MPVTCHAAYGAVSASYKGSSPTVMVQPPYNVCYPTVGCFAKGDRLTHPESLPYNPVVVNTMFFLYSRSNRVYPVTLNYLTPSYMKNLAQFERAKPLKYLVHGWMESRYVAWLLNIKEALLEEVRPIFFLQ